MSVRKAVPVDTAALAAELNRLVAVLQELGHRGRAATFAELARQVVRAAPDADPRQVADVLAVAGFARLALEAEVPDLAEEELARLALVGLGLVAGSPTTALRHAQQEGGV